MALAGERGERPLAQAARLLERHQRQLRRPRSPRWGVPDQRQPADVVPALDARGSSTNAKSTMPLPTESVSCVERPISNRVVTSREGRAERLHHLRQHLLGGVLGGADHDRLLGCGTVSRSIDSSWTSMMCRASASTRLALGGEPHVAAVLLEQLALEAAFEQPHVLAQRGLADVPHGGRLAEPAALGDRDQRPQVLKVE